MKRATVLIVLFEGLKRKQLSRKKRKITLSLILKKATNVAKLYLLPKMHKMLNKVPGRPVISNCRTPTEKVSKFLKDHHLQPVMNTEMK